MPQGNTYVNVPGNHPEVGQSERINEYDDEGKGLDVGQPQVSGA